MKAEILAPAGNFEALRAAVLNGADAVYFGTGNFNARRNAGNFDGDDLKRAIEFCHTHGVKCHIALNTLVRDSELPELIKTVKRTCEYSADALILQDLGVAEIVKSICPEMEIHASTQLSTGTLQGLFELKRLGFLRAVLPRELSREEIEAIAENTPVELEMFVHGALCMSVSGQCLLSAMLGSRSGNRGLCAQPCRLPFKAENGTGTDLSLKDLSLVEDIKYLSGIGISSFKIEGRMKRPEYVAAAVAACRESLEGEYSEQRKDELKSLFSRSGFTKGYYEAKLGRDMFGKREKENVTSATGELLKKYEHTYEKEKPIYKVDFEFSAHENEKAVLCASLNGVTVTSVSASVCEMARTRPLTEASVKTQLQKCGGTVFFAGSVKCDIGENVSVPLSAVNSLRRDALGKLTETLSKGRQYNINDYCLNIKPHRSFLREKYLCFSSVGQIPENAEYSKMFLPLDTDKAVLEKYGAGVVIPRGLFGNADSVLEKLKRSGAKYALCNTLDAVATAKKAGVNIVGGPFLNAFNSVSLGVLESIGVCETAVSYELTAEQISSLGGKIKRGAAVYGRTPLMLTRNCPVKNGKSCAQCKRTGFLTDRLGIEFPVSCENGFSQLFNSRPTYIADKIGEIRNTDFDMFMFTDETKSECERILNAYKLGLKPKGEFTRGLFFRGVE